MENHSIQKKEGFLSLNYADAIPVLLLILILAIATFFRLYQLDSLPPGLFQDVAFNGISALDSLEKNEFKMSYKGDEGLFIYLVALSFSIFGASIWSIKIVAAVIGILTVVGLYLFAKELFSLTNDKLSSEIIALVSSFLLAISSWHTNFSRLGFRAILLPFVLVFSFYFLFKGFRRKKVLDYIVSGIFLGLGFYTYTAYRVIILLLPATIFFLFLIYRDKKEEKQFAPLATYCLLTIALVVLPFGIYFLQNPDQFFVRAADVSIFKQESPLGALFSNLIKYLGMFNFSGDPTWQHNYPGSTQLFWPVGILFLIGFSFSIKEVIAAVKNKNYPLLYLHGSLLSWFFIFLLPGVLSYGAPSSLRTIGIIPIVFIFAAEGGWFLYNYLIYELPRLKGRGIPSGKFFCGLSLLPRPQGILPQNKKENYKNLLILASVIFLLIAGIAEFKKYFIDWGRSQELENTFLTYQLKIGEYLNSLAPDVQKYVIADYILVDNLGRQVPFLNFPELAQGPFFIEKAWMFNHPNDPPKEPTIYLTPEALDKINTNGELSIYKSGKVVIVPLFHYPDFLEKISEKFPGGKIENHNGVWSYEIN